MSFPWFYTQKKADYLLYVDGKTAGVIEAQKTGTTLTGVETQSDKYAKGLPDGLPAWSISLPFCYESTGDETLFTNNLDQNPDPDRSLPFKSRITSLRKQRESPLKPPHHFRVDSLWDGYAALEKAKVKGANAPHILTDLVSLVRFAMHQDNELVSFPEKVENSKFRNSAQIPGTPYLIIWKSGQIPISVVQ